MLGRLRSLNRLELAGESIRAALEALAAAAPAWLAGVIDQEWAGVYGSRIDNLHLPASDTKRAALALSYGRDGYRLLEAVYAPGAPAWLAELPAVETLRRIWVQQYYRVIDGAGEQVIRREATEQGLPPGRSRLVSPYDLDARYSEKRGTGWTGYKAHLTETCSTSGEDDPDTGRPAAPNLITHVATTAATVPATRRRSGDAWVIDDILDWAAPIAAAARFAGNCRGAVLGAGGWEQQRLVMAAQSADPARDLGRRPGPGRGGRRTRRRL